MYDYKVKFTSEDGINEEYSIYEVIGQVEAIIEAKEKLLDRLKGEINRPGFRRDITIKITRIND